MRRVPTIQYDNTPYCAVLFFSCRHRIHVRTDLGEDVVVCGQNIILYYCRAVRHQSTFVLVRQNTRFIEAALDTYSGIYAKTVYSPRPEVARRVYGPNILHPVCYGSREKFYIIHRTSVYIIPAL